MDTEACVRDSIALADVVLLCTPPGFRPIHFEEAIRNNKHVFMEKPVATDPAGVQKVLAAAAEAKKIAAQEAAAAKKLAAEQAMAKALEVAAAKKAEAEAKKQAALEAGIPETYASRQGQWLKKHPMVVASLERELDDAELRKLQKLIHEINSKMDCCKEILGIEE
jgi:hypothetical protein